MTTRTTKPSAWLTTLTVAVFVAGASTARLPAEEVDFLSDPIAGIGLEHQQQWGDFGFDTAAARTGLRWMYRVSS